MRRRWVSTGFAALGSVGLLVGFPSSGEACLFCWLFHPWCPPQGAYGPALQPGYAAPTFAQYGPQPGSCAGPTQSFYPPSTCNGPIQTYYPPAASCAGPTEAFYPPQGDCGLETGPPAPAADEVPRTFRQRPMTDYEEPPVPDETQEPADPQEAGPADAEQSGPEQPGNGSASARREQWQEHEARRTPAEETVESDQPTGESVIDGRRPAPMSTPDSGSGTPEEAGQQDADSAGGASGADGASGPALGRLEKKITWSPTVSRKRLRIRRTSLTAEAPMERTRQVAENAGWVPVHTRAEHGVKVSATETDR